MDLFDEILQYHHSSLSLTEKYARLYALLERVCKQISASYKIDFSNLFSRLYAVCNRTGYKRSSIERFRINARRIMRGEMRTDENIYLYDLKALSEAISHFFNIPIPPKLVAILPKEWKAQTDFYKKDTIVKRIRLIVERWDEKCIYGYSDMYPSDQPLQVNYHSIRIFAELPNILFPGAQLNLLTVTSDESGVLTPELFILEPDYLIDISTLAECFQNYGCSPLNYLINKFRPRETTHHILLGNAANQFLDDCVNEQARQPASYEHSMLKVFKSGILEYSACDKIDKDFFDKARLQFNYIHDTVQAVFNSPSCQIDKGGALLEPSFLCENMGLQGRMDFLQCDFRNLIELKSGKAEGIGMNVRSKESHALQMALYKEVLYYNLDVPRDITTTYLFYSQYPKMFAERSAKAQIQRAMQLRNLIVANELVLKNNGGRTLFPSITPEKLNTHNTEGRLWNEFQYPQLEKFFAPFHQSDSLALDYFYTFTAFVAREQFLSKTGDAQCDSSHGFANTWNSDTLAKQASGNILTDLHIIDFEQNEGIEKIHLEVPSYDENFLPNFRIGDIVLLYERNNEEDNATNRQIIRGSIEKINSKRLTLYLRNKQRNPLVFHQQSMYAIEHDFMDSSYSTLYRGLYSLLTTDKERKDLLLCQRRPCTNTSLTLNKHYYNAQIDDIVLQAKQAQDYFLLVGPPGTGKTSVALKSMVEEFYCNPDCNLLLLSYTNRAVDEICEMLESISPQPLYLRIGNELACEEKFRPHLLKNITNSCKRRSEVLQTIENIRIITGTVSSISGHPELFRLKHFDVAIIDEASQILEPQIMGILCAQTEQHTCAIKKFILIGDHKQLPAVVMQRPEESTVTLSNLQTIGLTNCRNSLFERLYTQQKLHPSSGILAMLNRQGRMHPEISAFANHFFYSGLLDIIPVKHQCEPLEWTLHTPRNNTIEEFAATTRLGFINVPYPPAEDSNKINRQEALTVARLVATLYKLCKKNGCTLDISQRIGIIVPFRNQIAMIAHELSKLNITGTEKITIDTVERYQGSQRDIIIYSTTVSQPYQLEILSVPVETDGLYIDRKLNVAITRARKQLFIIGNAHLLKQQAIYRQFIEFIEKKGKFTEYSSFNFN